MNTNTQKTMAREILSGVILELHQAMLDGSQPTEKGIVSIAERLNYVYSLIN